jgi:hypothetical protein
MTELNREDLKRLGISTPQLATATAMDRMTDAEYVYSLSKIETQKEKMQILLAKSIGDNIKEFSFLSKYAQDRLLLNLSDRQATGRRSIVDMLKAPIISFGTEMKQGIKDFIGSNGQGQR